MIKAEVVFNGDEIMCNGKLISRNKDGCVLIDDYHVSICINGVDNNIDTIEKAIKYCLEN